MKFSFIEELRSRHPVRRLCSLLEVSPSGHGTPRTSRRARDAEVLTRPSQVERRDLPLCVPQGRKADQEPTVGLEDRMRSGRTSGEAHSRLPANSREKLGQSRRSRYGLDAVDGTQDALDIFSTRHHQRGRPAGRCRQARRRKRDRKGTIGPIWPNFQFSEVDLSPFVEMS